MNRKLTLTGIAICLAMACDMGADIDEPCPDGSCAVDADEHGDGDADVAGDGDADGDADGGLDADAEADGNPDIDAESESSLDADLCELPCGSSCCAAGERCFRDACIPDNGDCSEDEPCQHDSSCVDDTCVPFGVPPLGEFDPECARIIEASFEPVIQCEWPGELSIDTPESTSVSEPPLVGDLDGDGIPEIVFLSFDYTSHLPRIRAINGATCEPLWTTARNQHIHSKLVLADLEGDGEIEVCGRGSDGVPFCLDSRGELLWEGHDDSGSVGVNPGELTSLAVVNVDGSGAPELVVGLSVFDGLTGLYLGGVATPASPFNWGFLWALADVDGDGHIESLTGAGIVDLVTFESTSWPTSAGYTAVAELAEESPGPEVVVVDPQSNTIRVQALDGTVLYSHAVPGTRGGPPTIADLDGDGQAEFSTAGMSFLTAFDLDCDTNFPSTTSGVCSGGSEDGVLWSQPSHEFSSGVTGSVVFDFEGDGPVEVVYADECWTRIYDGETGTVRFSAPHCSLTIHEYPVVADVDGDFHTEIVVPHWSYPEIGCPLEDPLMPGVTAEPGCPYDGITVYRDREDSWAPSRPLWSQHTEHWSNRLDDGTVPLVETPSWLTHNSYRQALLSDYPESALYIPDLTVGDLTAPSCRTTDDVQSLEVSVCNRGTLPAASGIRVEFHADSLEGPLACSATTLETLAPGECTRVACDWLDLPMNEPHDVYVVVDPPVGGPGALGECKEDNNLTWGDGIRCPPVDW